MSVSANELVVMLSSWMWPFIRIGAMLFIMPLYGGRFVPVRVRLGFAVVLSIVIVPLLPDPPAVSPLSPTGLLITIQQVLVGLLLGFVLRLVWSVFEIAGQVISQPMGLHFASMVDPTSGVQVPVVAQFYVVVGTLVFLALNGHLVFLQAMADSFTVLPVSVDGIGRDGIWHLVLQMGWAFASALLVALPAVTALLVVNFAFAVITRAAPQLNIFAVGFPVTLGLGFVVMFVTLPVIVEQFGSMFSEGLAFMTDLAAGSF